MAQEPKVFIVNDSGHDYSSARVYGELVAMTKGTVPYIRKTRVLKMYRDITEILKDSKKEDYILQSGPSILFMISCIAFVVKHRRLNLLIFDGKVYVVRNLLVDVVFTDEKGDQPVEK